MLSLIVAEEEKVPENQLNHNPVAENVAETLDPILAIKKKVDFLIAPEPPLEATGAALLRGHPTSC